MKIPDPSGKLCSCTSGLSHLNLISSPHTSLTISRPSFPITTGASHIAWTVTRSIFLNFSNSQTSIQSTICGFLLFLNFPTKFIFPKRKTVKFCLNNCFIRSHFSAQCMTFVMPLFLGQFTFKTTVQDTELAVIRQLLISFYQE